MSHDLDHIDPFIEHSESFVPSFLGVSTTHVFVFANRMIFLVFLFVVIAIDVVFTVWWDNPTGWGTFEYA
jgi:hypothetical protein